MSVAVMGVQAPRVQHVPKVAWSDADDAAFLASSYGLTPDPWQHRILEAWLGRKRDGRLAAGRCGLAVPRQNGKNGVLEVAELFKIVVLGRKVLHTAHEVKTARKAFLRLASFFENERQFPELAALASDIRRTNGQEAILLSNGGSVEFVARSRGSGRGFTVDDLVLDEAQELTDEQLEALMPTISSAPSGDPQMILTGTPPGPNSPGEVFTRTRTAGVEGKDVRLAWHEWSVDVPLDKLDVRDRALWAATNPSLGIRLNLSVIEDEVAQMSLEGFARERLGRWDSADDHGLARLDPAVWGASADPDSQIVGALSFGVAMSPDKSTVAVGAVGLRADGRYHAEIIRAERQSTWLFKPDEEGIPWLTALGERHAPLATVVDPGSAAGSLLPDMDAAGIDVHVVTVGELCHSCGRLYDLLEGDRLRHLGQAPLDAAVRESKAHVLARGGWIWRPSGDRHIVELNAITLALAGFDEHAEADYDVMDSLG